MSQIKLFFIIPLFSVHNEFITIILTFFHYLSRHVVIMLNNEILSSELFTSKNFHFFFFWYDYII